MPEAQAFVGETFSHYRILEKLGGGGHSAVLRIRLGDGKTEQVVDLAHFVYTGHFSDSSLSLAPDDSPLLFREAGTSDVYSLDWEEP